MRAFVHGFGLGPGMWTNIATASDLLLVVPGHQGRPIETGASFEAVADALAAELARGCHLIGYSMGGRLALAMALRHPDKVDRLTLLSCHAGIRDPQQRAARFELDRELADSIQARGLQWFHDYWQSLPMWSTQSMCTPRARRAQRELRLGNQPTGLARALRALGPGSMPDYHPVLGSLLPDAEILVGELDERYRRAAEAMAAAMPAAPLHTVAGAGHNLVLEAPGAVAELLGGRREVAL